MRVNARKLTIYMMSFMLAIILNSMPAAAGEKVYKMKAESVWSSVSTTTTAGLNKYLDLVEQKSKGRIKFQRFADAALAKPKMALDALEVGAIDVLLSYPAYYSGMVPEGEIFANPFLFEKMKSVLDIYYNTEVGTLVQEAYKEKGAVLLCPLIMSANILSTRNKVENLEQLKGLKIRSSGGVVAQTCKAMGASPVMLVGSEIYTGLQRGIVDGYIYALYSAWDYKFYEQAKYIVQPDLGFIVVDIWISKRAFDSLPQDLQKIFMAAGKEHANNMLIRAEKAVEGSWKKLKEVGVEAVNFSAADMEELKKRFKANVWPTYVKNQRCKKILDICLKHEGL